MDGVERSEVSGVDDIAPMAARGFTDSGVEIRCSSRRARDDSGEEVVLHSQTDQVRFNTDKFFGFCYAKHPAFIILELYSLSS